MVDDNTVISGSTDQVRAVLERDKEPELSATLRAALQEADPSRTVFAALDFKDVAPGPWLGVSRFPLPEGVVGLAIGAEAGSSFQVSVTWLCRDAHTAADVRQSVDAALVAAKYDRTLPRELADALGGVKASTNGAQVTGKLQLNPAAVIKMLTRPAAPPPPEPAGAGLTATALLQAYQTDEAAADRQFKGKEITIVDKVRGLSVRYAKLGPKLDINGKTPSVRCDFADPNDVAIGWLGKVIVVQGTCQGKVPRPRGGFDIVLENCKFIEQVK